MDDPTLAGLALKLIADHRTAESHVNATEALQRFFQLLEQVVADEKSIVYVGHKDLPVRGAIVSEAFLAYVHQLEQITSSLASQALPSFALFGTATAAGDIEEDIAALRDEQNAHETRRDTSLRIR